MTEKFVAHMPELNSDWTGQGFKGIAEHKLDPKENDAPKDPFEESEAFGDGHHSPKHTAETSDQLTGPFKAP